jgi:hypothetical protein
MNPIDHDATARSRIVQSRNKAKLAAFDALLDSLRETMRELTGSYGKNTTEHRRSRITERAQAAIVAAEEALT